jgi:hypothetical protein
VKLEDIYQKFFEFEFCESGEKPAREKELNAILAKACEETDRPLYILKPAILKCYRHYRAERLRNELPPCHRASAHDEINAAGCWGGLALNGSVV